MGVRFAIGDWAACAPGLAARPEWEAWAAAPWPPAGALEARLEAMPAMQRRRLNPLGRAAAEVAWACHTPAPATPVVFASGHGDATRCLHLLKEFAATDTASPTDFTLSVHNAISAMYSITRGDTASYTSVAAGPASAAAGVVEACALLADGAAEVLLVCYEAPLPGEYAAFEREAPAAYAWAWRLLPPAPGQPQLELAWSAEADAADAANAANAANAAPAELPFGLQALRFALSGQPRSEACVDGMRWSWSRHG
jgi:hypothetical protein